MDEYIGIVKLFAGNFPPRGWAFCNGQIMSIAQNTALYSILGTTYGGDGRTTFALPNLGGRVPVGTGKSTTGSNYTAGQMAGQENVTLLQTEIPQHTHIIQANAGVGYANDSTGNLLNGGQAQAERRSPPLPNNSVTTSE